MAGFFFVYQLDLRNSKIMYIFAFDNFLFCHAYHLLIFWNHFQILLERP